MSFTACMLLQLALYLGKTQHQMMVGHEARNFSGSAMRQVISTVQLIFGKLLAQ